MAKTIEYLNISASYQGETFSVSGPKADALPLYREWRESVKPTTVTVPRKPRPRRR